MSASFADVTHGSREKRGETHVRMSRLLSPLHRTGRSGSILEYTKKGAGVKSISSCGGVLLCPRRLYAFPLGEYLLLLLLVVSLRIPWEVWQC